MSQKKQIKSNSQLFQDEMGQPIHSLENYNGSYEFLMHASNFYDLSSKENSGRLEHYIMCGKNEFSNSPYLGRKMNENTESSPELKNKDKRFRQPFQLQNLNNMYQNEDPTGPSSSILNSAKITQPDEKVELNENELEEIDKLEELQQNYNETDEEIELSCSNTNSNIMEDENRFEDCMVLKNLNDSCERRSLDTLYEEERKACKELLDEYREHVERLELSMYNQKCESKTIAQKLSQKLLKLHNYIYSQCAKQEFYFQEASAFFEDRKEIQNLFINLGLSTIDERSEEESTTNRKDLTLPDLMDQIKLLRTMLSKAFENEHKLMDLYKKKMEMDSQTIDSLMSCSQQIDDEKKIEMKKSFILEKENQELRKQMSDKSSEESSAHNSSMNNYNKGSRTNSSCTYSNYESMQEMNNDESNATLVEKLIQENNTLKLTVERFTNKNSILERELQLVKAQLEGNSGDTLKKKLAALESEREKERDAENKLVRQLKEEIKKFNKERTELKNKLIESEDNREYLRHKINLMKEQLFQLSNIHQTNSQTPKILELMYNIPSEQLTFNHSQPINSHKTQSNSSMGIPMIPKQNSLSEFNQSGADSPNLRNTGSSECWSSLRNEISTLKERTIILEKEKRNLEEMMKKHRNEKQDEMDELEKRLENSETNYIIQLESMREAFQARENIYRNEIQMKNTEINKLHSSFQKQLEALDSIKQKAQFQLDLKYNRKIESLEKKLNASHKKIRLLSKSTERNHLPFESCTTKSFNVDLMDAQMTESKEPEMHTLINEIGHLKEDILNIHQNYLEKQKTFNSSQTNNELGELIKEVRTELEKRNDDVQSENELNKLKEQKNELEKQIVLLKERLEESQKKIQSLEGDKTSLQDIITTHEKKHEAINQEKNSLNEQILQLTQQVSMCKCKVHEKTIASVREELKKMEEKNKILNQTINNKEKYIRGIDLKYKEITMNSQLKDSAIKKAQMVIRKLNAHTEKMKNKADKYKSQNKDLKLQNLQLKPENLKELERTKNDEIKELKTSTENLKEEVSKFKKEGVKMEEKIKDLTNIIEAKNEKKEEMLIIQKKDAAIECLEEEIRKIKEQKEEWERVITEEREENHKKMEQLLRQADNSMKYLKSKLDAYERNETQNPGKEQSFYSFNNSFCDRAEFSISPIKDKDNSTDCTNISKFRCSKICTTMPTRNRSSNLERPDNSFAYLQSFGNDNDLDGNEKQVNLHNQKYLNKSNCQLESSSFVESKHYASDNRALVAALETLNKTKRPQYSYAIVSLLENELNNEIAKRLDLQQKYEECVEELKETIETMERGMLQNQKITNLNMEKWESTAIDLMAKLDQANKNETYLQKMIKEQNSIIVKSLNQTNGFKAMLSQVKKEAMENEDSHTMEKLEYERIKRADNDKISKLEEKNEFLQLDIDQKSQKIENMKARIQEINDSLCMELKNKELITSLQQERDDFQDQVHKLEHEGKIKEKRIEIMEKELLKKKQLHSSIQVISSMIANYGDSPRETKQSFLDRINISEVPYCYYKDDSTYYEKGRHENTLEIIEENKFSNTRKNLSLEFNETVTNTQSRNKAANILDENKTSYCAEDTFSPKSFSIVEDEENIKILSEKLRKLIEKEEWGRIQIQKLNSELNEIKNQYEEEKSFNEQEKINLKKDLKLKLEREKEIAEKIRAEVKREKSILEDQLIKKDTIIKALQNNNSILHSEVSQHKDSVAKDFHEFEEIINAKTHKMENLLSLLHERDREIELLKERLNRMTEDRDSLYMENQTVKNLLEENQDVILYYKNVVEEKSLDSTNMRHLIEKQKQRVNEFVNQIQCLSSEKEKLIIELAGMKNQVIKAKEIKHKNKNLKSEIKNLKKRLGKMSSSREDIDKKQKGLTTTLDSLKQQIYEYEKREENLRNEVKIKETQLIQLNEQNLFLAKQTKEFSLLSTQQENEKNKAFDDVKAALATQESENSTLLAKINLLAAEIESLQKKNKKIEENNAELEAKNIKQREFFTNLKKADEKILSIMEKRQSQTHSIPTSPMLSFYQTNESIPQRSPLQSEDLRKNISKTPNHKTSIEQFFNRESITPDNWDKKSLDLAKEKDSEALNEIISEKNNYIQELEKQISELRKELQSAMSKQFEAEEKLIDHLASYNASNDLGMSSSEVRTQSEQNGGLSGMRMAEILQENKKLKEENISLSRYYEFQKSEQKETLKSTDDDSKKLRERAQKAEERREKDKKKFQKRLKEFEIIMKYIEFELKWVQEVPINVLKENPQFQEYNQIKQNINTICSRNKILKGWINSMRDLLESKSKIIINRRQDLIELVSDLLHLLKGLHFSFKTEELVKLENEGLMKPGESDRFVLKHFCKEDLTNVINTLKAQMKKIIYTLNSGKQYD